MLSNMSNPQIYAISFRDRANDGRCTIYRQTDKGIEWVLESVKEELRRIGLEAYGFCISNLTQSN